MFGGGNYKTFYHPVCVMIAEREQKDTDSLCFTNERNMNKFKVTDKAYITKHLYSLERLVALIKTYKLYIRKDNVC